MTKDEWMMLLRESVRSYFLPITWTWAYFRRLAITGKY